MIKASHARAGPSIIHLAYGAAAAGRARDRLRGENAPWRGQFDRPDDW
jgi:hypothetical protein